MLEPSLRQSVAMGGGSIFFNRPISVGFLLAAVLLVVVTKTLLNRVPKELLEGDADA
jgi:TctA family transporter